MATTADEPHRREPFDAARSSLDEIARATEEPPGAWAMVYAADVAEGERVRGPGHEGVATIDSAWLRAYADDMIEMFWMVRRGLGHRVEVWRHTEPLPPEPTLTVDELAHALGHTVPPSKPDVDALLGSLTGIDPDHSEWEPGHSPSELRAALAAADTLNGELSRRLAEAERRATAYSGQLEDSRNGRDQLRDDLEQVKAALDQLNRTSVVVRRDLGDALRERDELREAITELTPATPVADALQRIAAAVERIADNTTPRKPLRIKWAP